MRLESMAMSVAVIASAISLYLMLTGDYQNGYGWQSIATTAACLGYVWKNRL
jgi:UDP-N-acetylmuramyl pentapeptide phosphotransferase/UDP-N-acetylglucosamine-1-phosphate transferase